MMPYPSAPTYPSTGAGGGGSVDPVTPPAAASESVAAGASLSAVTFGAFTDTGGRIASYSASKTNVVGSATISGTGLGPYTISGAADSEVLLIELDALDSGGNVLATAAYAGSIGSSTTGGSWVTLKDYDLTDLTTTSALSTGATTLGFESIADTIDVNLNKYSGGADITVTPTNGTGIVYDGGTDTTSTGTLSFRPSDWLASYTADDVQKYPYAVTFAFTVDFSNSYGDTKFYCGVNIGTNASHNSGESRHVMVTSDAGGVNEIVKIRTNTTESGTLATQAIRTLRTVTAVIHFGEIVQIIDSSGLTPPTIDVRQVAGTYVAGSDAVGRDDTSRVYQDSSGIRAFLSCGNTADLTLSRVIVQRYE